MDIEKEREAFKAALKDLDNESFFATPFDIWLAAKAQAVPEWISVKNALPPENTLVLALSKTFGDVFNLYDVMALDEFNESQTTHWMLLPEPPKESANE